MKILFFFSLLLVLFACKKDKKCVPVPVGSCLTAKFETFKLNPEAISILKTSKNGEDLFWLRSSAPTYDGVDYVLSVNCDTACILGGEGFSCLDGKNPDKMEVIWKK